MPSGQKIAKLYGMEESYRREKLTADEIYSRRNSKETTEVIEKIRTELYDLLANPDENRSELMDIDHLCCLAHARVKFKYAFDQGSPQARIFLEQIAKLYGMEDTYRREKLTADEIYPRRNSKETTEVIEKLSLIHI